MNIAVIGAGLSGLAAAWHLLQVEGVTVTLYDAKGVGGGASGAAAGLMHPYIGEQGRRSWMAAEGRAATLELVEVAEEILGFPVADRSGIIRTSEVEKLYEDIILLSDGSYLITSGVTIFMKPYLQGLFQACEKRGASLKIEKIENLGCLDHYDKVVFTVGAGIFGFDEWRHLKLGRTKGQALLCSLPEHAAPIEKSTVAKGYIARGETDGTFYVGSTYEKGAITDLPNLESALRDLEPKAASISKDVLPLQVLECRAGIRVNRSGHYIPLLESIGNRTYAITGMGSRGLLYHAYFGKLLKELLFNNGKIE